MTSSWAAAAAAVALGCGGVDASFAPGSADVGSGGQVVAEGGVVGSGGSALTEAAGAAGASRVELGAGGAAAAASGGATAAAGSPAGGSATMPLGGAPSATMGGGGNGGASAGAGGVSGSGQAGSSAAGGPSCEPVAPDSYACWCSFSTLDCGHRLTLRATDPKTGVVTSYACVPATDCTSARADMMAACCY